MNRFEREKEENLAIVLDLINTGTNLDARDSRGNIPIHRAAFLGQPGLVQVLIAAGAHVDTQDRWGNTSLHIAACHGQQEVIKELIAAGANPNQPNHEGITPLHFAAKFSYEKVVQILIVTGANITNKDTEGNTHTTQPILDLLVCYAKRIKHAKQRIPIIALVIAQATNERLGQSSPLILLPQHLLKDIAYLVAQTEEYEARQPHEQSQAEYLDEEPEQFRNTCCITQ